MNISYNDVFFEYEMSILRKINADKFNFNLYSSDH